MIQTDKSIHVKREMNSWKRKDSIPDSMEQQVTDLEGLMEILSELPDQWVTSGRIYQKINEKKGVNPSKRTVRRWISKLDQEEYVKTRGRTKSREIYSLVDGK